MLKALYEVVSKAGTHIGETSKALILSLVDEDIDEEDGTSYQILKLSSKY